jgi:4-amino-4-deoxy-L-arabinose transferase-like glycosyltransferase
LRRLAPTSIAFFQATYEYATQQKNSVKEAGMGVVERVRSSTGSGWFSDYRWVAWVLAIYFAVQAAVRIALSNSLRIDEAQQFVVGQWLAWGYDAQPPLYNWVQYGVFHLFGMNLASLVILKNVLLFLVYFAYLRLARELLEDKALAAIATLSLFTMPQMFWQAQRDLTHTVGTLLAVVVFIYFVVVTIRRPSLWSYAMIGLWAGLGMLTKYNFALVVASVLAAVVFLPVGPKRVLDRRFLLTIAIAIAVFLPHAIWMTSNMGLVVDRTAQTMSEHGEGGKLSDIFYGVVELLGTSAAIVAPTTVIFLVVFKQSFLRALKAKSEWSDFFGRFFYITALMLLVIILVVTLTAFRDRWLLPFLFMVPLYFCLKLEAAGNHSRTIAERFFYVPLVVMAALPVIIAGGVILSGAFGSYEHLNTPYATFLNRVLADKGQVPTAVVTTVWHKAGNIRINMPSTHVISTAYPASDLSREQIGAGPVLMVWDQRDGSRSQMPDELKNWLAGKFGTDVQKPEEFDLALPYYYGREPDRYHFGYAWFYPAK